MEKQQVISRHLAKTVSHSCTTRTFVDVENGTAHVWIPGEIREWVTSLGSLGFPPVEDTYLSLVLGHVGHSFSQADCHRNSFLLLHAAMDWSFHLLLWVIFLLLPFPLIPYGIFSEIHSILPSTLLTCPLHQAGHSWLCLCFCQTPKTSWTTLYVDSLCWRYWTPRDTLGWGSTQAEQLSSYLVWLYMCQDMDVPWYVWSRRRTQRGRRWESVLFFTKWLNWSHQASAPSSVDSLK